MAFALNWFSLGKMEQVATPTNNKTTGSSYSEYGYYYVSLSCATDGADIYYTIDGSEPTSASIKYTSSVYISAQVTMKAVAVKSGMENSEVMTCQFYLYSPSTPSISVGTSSTSTPVSISCSTGGATIEYQIGDGSWNTYSGTFYVTSGSTTVRARSYYGGLYSSTTQSYVYNKIPTPSMSPSGGTYSGSVTLSASCSKSGVSFTWYKDGIHWTTGSSVTLTSSANVTVRALYDNWLNSNAASGSFTIT